MILYIQDVMGKRILFLTFVSPVIIKPFLFSLVKQRGFGSPKSFQGRLVQILKESDSDLVMLNHNKVGDEHVEFHITSDKSHQTLIQLKKSEPPRTIRTAT